MVCKNCGAEIIQGTATCPRCGKTVELSPPIMAQKKKIWPVVLAGSCSKILLVAALFSFLILPFVSELEILPDAEEKFSGFIYALMGIAPIMDHESEFKVTNLLPLFSFICMIISLFWPFTRKQKKVSMFFSVSAMVLLLITAFTAKSYFVKTMGYVGYSEYVEVKILIGFYVSFICLLSSSIICLLKYK